MKAHHRLIGLFAIILVLLSACGGSSSSSSSGQGSSTLTVWIVQSGPAGDLIRSNIAKFQSAHKGVKINVLQYADADIKVKVKTALVAHDLPDVFTWWGGSYIDPEIKGDALLDLAPYINAHSDWKSTFVQDAFTNYTRGSKIYGVPNESPVVELWYNTALFAKAGIQGPPKSYDDLMNDVKQLNAHHIVPASLDGQEGWPLQEWYTYLVMRNGGYQAINDAMQGKASWASPPFVKAAQQLHELIQSNLFQPGFLGTGYTAATNMYYNQKAAMMLLGSWVLGDLSSPENKAVAQNTKFVDFPVTPGGQGTVDEAQGGPNNCWVVNANTKNPQLAQDLVRYMTSSPQTDQYLSQTLQIVPNKVTIPSSTPPLFNAVVSRTREYQHYNLFWNEILPSAASTQYIDLLNQMAAGQISPEDMCNHFQSYMQQNAGG